MANLLSVAVVLPIANTHFPVGTVGLNVDNIQSIKTVVPSAGFPGISLIYYKYSSENGSYFKTVKIYSSVDAATLITSANT